MTRKIDQPVTLFAQVEAAQHEKLRALAFQEKRSIAELVRDALEGYLKGRRAATVPKLAIREERIEAAPRRKAASR